MHASNNRQAMNPKDWSEFCGVAQKELCYGKGEKNKARFHSLGKKICKALASDLCLPVGTFDVHSNPAGCGSSGEITLHGDGVYIQFGEAGFCGGILFRSCKSRKDHAGQNNHAGYRHVADDYVRFLQSVGSVARRG